MGGDPALALEAYQPPYFVPAVYLCFLFSTCPSRPGPFFSFHIHMPVCTSCQQRPLYVLYFRLIVLIFLRISKSPIVVSVSKPRVYLYSLGEISDGFVILVLSILYNIVSETVRALVE